MDLRSAATRLRVMTAAALSMLVLPVMSAQAAPPNVLRFSTAAAQTPVALTISAPVTVDLGTRRIVTVKALLSTGVPLVNGIITLYGGPGADSYNLGAAHTDATGVAKIGVVADFPGMFRYHSRYAGSTRYAPSTSRTITNYDQWRDYPRPTSRAAMAFWLEATTGAWILSTEDDFRIRPTAMATRAEVAYDLRSEFWDFESYYALTCIQRAGQDAQFVTNTFDDVADVHPYCGEMNVVGAPTRNGLGTHTANFRPDTAVTRGALAAMMYSTVHWTNGRSKVPDRAAPTCRTGATRIFTDVPADATFCGSIEALARLGVVRGSGGRFLPDRPVTNAELAVFLSRWYVRVF